MGRIPKELREIIAKNIRDCRLKMFPGRGGSKKCAAALGVSPQQWSPWERGIRAPDEDRMISIHNFRDKACCTQKNPARFLSCVLPLIQRECLSFQ